MTPDRYRLIRTIATGGMAHVYEAVAQGQAGFERRVAIKRVLPELSHDESMRRMFLDEARIASHLHHGNIVPVLDYGVVDGSEFIAMEYVDGVDAQRANSLAAQRGDRMPQPLALHVLAEIAHALDYAHGRLDAEGRPLGIVHRDVSPHNILLSWDGDVKLSDFGIAKATEREERTQTGVVKGKLAYMSPEQAAGREVAPASDVYALGATLHALLTGNAPGGGGLGAAIDDTDPRLSEEVLDLIRTCMDVESANRPATSAVAFRAGQLAARAMDRDARGALSEWLAPLRSTVGKVSALDDLMGLALVASGEGEAREFTVSRFEEAPPVEAETRSPAEELLLRPSRAPTALATPSGPAPEAPALPEVTETVRIPVRWGGRRVAAVGALLVAVVVAGTVAFGGLAAEPTPAVERATPAEPTTGEAAGSGEAGEPAPLPRAETPPPREDPSVERRPAPPAGRRRPPRRASPDPPVAGSGPPRVEPVADPPRAPDPPPAEATGAPGFLRIPRGTGGQERVEIDGRPRGFTPTVLSLSVGPHRVVIRDADTGGVLAERSVELGTHHTRVSPLVVGR